MKKILIYGLLLMFAITSCSKDDDDKEIKIETKVIEVESLTLSATEFGLVEGTTKDLSVTVLPKTATDKTVTWTSSDETIATVELGLITAIAEGEVSIIVTSKNNKKATCKLTVTKKIIEVEAIMLTPTKATIDVDDVVKLTLALSPSNATDASVTWTSSDAKIATVKDGTVTAIAVGEAVITVATANGKTATCNITVESGIIEVTSVTIDKGDSYTTKTDFIVFKVEVLPSDAVDKTITWTTSNPEMGSLSKDGMWLGKKAGVATITATAANGIKATCELTYDCTPVTGITSEPTMTVEEGDPFKLIYAVIPADASNNWTKKPVITGPEGGMTYSGYGTGYTYTATKAGEYTITLETEDGGFKTTSTVTVVAAEIINVTPEGMVGNWVGKTIKLYDINKGTYIGKEGIAKMLGKTLPETEKWMTDVATQYTYTAGAAGVLVWHVPLTGGEVKDLDLQLTKLGEIYNFKLDVATSGIKFSDKPAINARYGKQRTAVEEDGTVSLQTPVTASLNIVTYYTVSKEEAPEPSTYANRANMKQLLSKLKELDNSKNEFNHSRR